MRRPGNWFTAVSEIHVDAPPERVFELLCDVSRHPVWAGSGEPVAAKLVGEGPLKLGSLFDVEERFGRGRRVDVRCEVCAFDPPKELRWRVSQLTRPPEFRSEWSFELEPENGGTRVRHIWDLDRANSLRWRLIMALFFGLMRRGQKMRAAMQASLENIKREVETRASPATRGR